MISVSYWNIDSVLWTYFVIKIICVSQNQNRWSARKLQYVHPCYTKFWNRSFCSWLHAELLYLATSLPQHVVFWPVSICLLPSCSCRPCVELDTMSSLTRRMTSITKSCRCVRKWTENRDVLDVKLRSKRRAWLTNITIWSAVGPP